MSKKFDKRIWFVGQSCRRFSVAANVANAWYINYKAEKMGNEQALRAFKEWMRND